MPNCSNSYTSLHARLPSTKWTDRIGQFISLDKALITTRTRVNVGWIQSPNHREDPQAKGEIPRALGRKEKDLKSFVEQMLLLYPWYQCNVEHSATVSQRHGFEFEPTCQLFSLVCLLSSGVSLVAHGNKTRGLLPHYWSWRKLRGWLNSQSAHITITIELKLLNKKN